MWRVPTVAVEPPNRSAPEQHGQVGQLSSTAIPLLRKPQQYYDNTKSNKVVKTAAAAVVGVPAGIVGELKQIVVGAPTATPAPAY